MVFPGPPLVSPSGGGATLLPALFGEKWVRGEEKVAASVETSEMGNVVADSSKEMAHISAPTRVF